MAASASEWPRQGRETPRTLNPGHGLLVASASRPCSGRTLPSHTDEPPVPRSELVRHILHSAFGILH